MANLSCDHLSKIVTSILGVIFFQWLLSLACAIFVRDPRPSWKCYITGSPSDFFSNGTPSWILCEHHRKSTDKVTRPGLHSEASVPSHFSSSSRRDSAAFSSGSRHSLGGSQWRDHPLPPLHLSCPSTKPKREAESSCFNPSLASLFRHSNVGRSADRWDVGERSSLSISRSFNPRTKRNTSKNSLIKKSLVNKVKDSYTSDIILIKLWSSYKRYKKYKR